MAELQPSRPRPRGVTLLALGVLTIAGLNTARFILALVRWQELADFSGVSRFYIALTGAGWAATAWPLAWGVWRGKNWAPRGMRLAVFVFSAYYWLDRLLLTDRTGWFGPSLPTNWLFMAGLNGIGFWLVYWILSRHKSKDFFGERYERTSYDQ